MIKKLTSLGDELWTYVNPLNNFYQYCTTIQFYNDNLWLVAQGWGTDAYNKLIELNDSINDVLQEIELIPEDNLLYYAEAMELDEQGVVLTCMEFGDESAGKPSIYKMDYEGNFLWKTTPAGEFDWRQRNDHMVKSADGGYVSCSVQYDTQPNPEDPNDASSNNTSEKIWLWKVDSNGVFQWQRFYEYLGFEIGYLWLDNTANDLKATPDGGYIMAGEATARCLDWPCLAGDPFTQEGWLLKVDGCGCLVPGCDENCNLEVDPAPEPQLPFMKIGPIPAHDMFNIYLNDFDTELYGVLLLHVHDMQGRLVHSFQLNHDDTTYMINTNSLASGDYVLSLMSSAETPNGKLLQRVKVVVAR